MPPSHSQTKIPKFTRGEKCLFIHLIVTFTIIMLMTITYFVHLCLVNHTKSEVFKIYRRTYDKSYSGLSLSDYQSIGVIYLNITPPTIICNTLLLGERWSLAPAQCTSMRDDPDMSNYLLMWKIKYKLNGKHAHSDIKRTLTHSHFNRGDYLNNIGLFEHAVPIFKKQYYVAPTNILVNDEMLQKYENQMVIIDWELNFSKKDHGAMFVMNSKIIGFFSWGDIKGRGVPLVILNIIHFREWFESILKSSFELVK